MGKTLRQMELGEFLRRHRDQAHPPDGISADPRRRAKGLRRSEVANSVGITEQWYTDLEQGRAVAVSPQVLLGLSGVLNLTWAQKEHLFVLAGKQLPDEVQREVRVVPAHLRRYLDSRGCSPCYIIDRCWNALAWNVAAQALLYDLEALSRKDRNVMLLALTDATFRESVADWEVYARTLLKFFRRDYGLSVEDPRIREVVAALAARSDEFRQWWPLQEVDNHVRVRLTRSAGGDARLVFDRVTFLPAEYPSLRVVVFEPVSNTGTEQQAARLIAEYQRRGSVVGQPTLREGARSNGKVGAAVAV
jgi:transcriptional regulator with XRE-family HTH domain